MVLKRILETVSRAGIVDNIIFFAENKEDLKYIDSLDIPGKIVCIDKDINNITSPVIKLPFRVNNITEVINLAILLGCDDHILDKDKTILCVFKINSDKFDTIFINSSNDINSKIYNLLKFDCVNTEVLSYIIDLAIEFGYEGVDDKSIGAIFMIGDSEKVMELSRSISYYPFENNYASIMDENARDVIKALAKLDGAFVINNDGRIVGVSRYLDVPTQGIDIPKGLGARHISAASMTKNTNAIAIVLSETDKKVRLFKDGKLLAEIT
ncbi:MAG: diadenylate cyclase [Candidatus Methanoliparum thermophilum]|uniref:Diadenylate cyclase n=1 Tax=Methanoliparum thermophilum TaxID=2491083 RepID=A0A520KU43_METT2|nr:MAG: diadenylate cyclase [Candidatus Methanoliparum thermophilum]